MVATSAVSPAKGSLTASVGLTPRRNASRPRAPGLPSGGSARCTSPVRAFWLALAILASAPRFVRVVSLAQRRLPVRGSRLTPHHSCTSVWGPLCG